MNCSWVFNKQDFPTLESVKEKLINLGYTNDQLRLSTLVSAFFSKGKKYEIVMTISKNILYKLVTDVHYLIYREKIVQEMWNALEI